MFQTLSDLSTTLSKASVNFARAVWPQRGDGRPPLLDGRLPLLGHMRDFDRAPVDLLTRGFRSMGDTFNVQLLNKQVTVLIGVEGNELFFRAPERQLSPREVYRFTTPVFGEGLVYDAEPEVMSEQMGFLMPALRDRNMRTYAQVMAEEVERYIDSLPEQGEIDLVDAFTELTTFMSTRCLLGKEFRDSLTNEFARLFHDLEQGMNQIAFFAPHLPLPVFRRRDAARRKAVEMIGRIVRARRASGVEEVDFLQALVDARYKRSGKALTEDEITGLLLTIVFAGHHNSSVTAAWTTIELLSHPQWIAGLLEEQADVHGDHGEISFESLRRLERLERVIKEVGRLHPPLIMLMRAVNEDVSFKQWRVPAGDLMLVSPAVSHRDARVFANPDRFDPDRFAPPREEDKKPHALITFGGGRHRCIGTAFAHMLLKTLWSVLLRRVELELVDRSYRPDYTGFVVGPRKPARARFRKVRRPYVAYGA